MTITIKNFVLFVWLFILAGCGSSTDIDMINKSSNNNRPVFTSFDIPPTEHGYRLLKSQVIRSKRALNTFIQKVDQQPYWNNKAAFIAALRKTPIDFSHYALILFFHDETSSMISISLGKPEWNPTENSIRVPLYNDVKQGDYLTTDMVYYGYAFVADNRLAMAELRSAQESERVIVSNHYGHHPFCLQKALQLTSSVCC